MAIVNGWLDWAIKRPGPSRKVNAGTNGYLGIAHHSAEGFEQGLWSVLDGPRNASWHFSNMRDGRMFQHYPISARTWTTGAQFPNDNFPSVETEGTASMPLTVAQIQNIVRLNKELKEFSKRPISTRNMTQIGLSGRHFLLEHREASVWGASPTSCPSNRYNWTSILDSLNYVPAPPPPKVPEIEAPKPDDFGEEIGMIIKEPGANRHYLVRGFKVAWIPDKETFDGLVSIYGESKETTPEAFWFLVAEHQAAGYRWG